MLESVAGEHGARMTAMDSASKNANEMIGKLTLSTTVPVRLPSPRS